MYVCMHACTHNLQITSQGRIGSRQMPVRARHEAKAQREGEEDDLEDDVCADAADEVNEAEEAHEDPEEGCTCSKTQSVEGYLVVLDDGYPPKEL